MIPRLHLIGPPEGCDAAAYVAAVAAAPLDANVAVHVRMPGAPACEVLALAVEMRRVAGPACLIVNDRIDVALIIGADGVQLGERSLPVAACRRLIGAQRSIGRSVHDIGGAVAAERDGADYLVAGHVFATPSKPGMPGRGLAWLRALTQAVAIPVIAIGGITHERVGEVIAAGACGVAVSSPLGAPDAAARIAAYMERLGITT